MAQSSRDRRTRTRGSSSSSGARRNTASRRSSSRGRSSSASRTSQPRSRRGTLTRPDTGYSLHSRSVRRESSSNTGIATLLRPRVLLLIGILALVVVVLAVGISSCVRKNNEAASQSMEEAKPVNEQDARVAAGVSAAMTSRFTEALDNAELLAQIAENADQYDDERLLLLALREPSSLPFVMAYPTSDKSSRPYDGDVVRGETPELYDWDEHWGAVTYGDGPLAVTGSGPTTLAMAYMRLTGKTDFSPTEIAQQASKSNFADGDSGTKAEMFYKLPSSMGLESTYYEPAAETLLYTLGENTVFAIELNAGTLTDDAHWALASGMNEDGSVNVYDPTSSSVTSRPWSIYTLASSSNSFYAISISEEALADLAEGTDGKDGTTTDDTDSGTSADDTTDDTSDTTASADDDSSSSSVLADDDSESTGTSNDASTTGTKASGSTKKSGNR